MHEYNVINKTNENMHDKVDSVANIHRKVLRRGHTERRDSTKLFCWDESGRSRGHTKRRDATELFDWVGSFGVTAFTIRLD